MRQTVWVTWSARRLGGARWPAWSVVAGRFDGEGQPTVRPARSVVAQLAGAVVERLAQEGAVFGCGVWLDADGLEQEAACEVMAVRVGSCPSPECGERAEVRALVELEGEVRYGPNSFELGRRLAALLGGARWQIEGGDAELVVERVEVEASTEGLVAIYPARESLF
ncbi:hypothetical protein ACWGIR_23020 [Streptomyces albidoflavus]